jgi:hypothetical protein
MADHPPPHIFMGQYDATAMANARLRFDSGVFAAVSKLVDARVEGLLKTAATQPKCGADLKGLMAARAVLMMLARPNVHLARAGFRRARYTKL